MGGIIGRTCARCGSIVKGRCPRCEQKGDRARGSAASRGYDPAWAALSRAWRLRYPWCGQRMDGQLYPEHSRCVQRGERQRAQVTDHIRPLRAGGDKTAPSNLQSLCVSCNTAKGSRDDTK